MKWRALSILFFSLCLAGQGWKDKIDLGGEFRGRAESNGEGYYLHRIRLNLNIEPVPVVRFVAQVQDAKIVANQETPEAPPFRDALDLRLAYVEVGGNAGKHFGLRAGRQEINVGQQWLVGSSNWANAARSFDAVRGYWRPRRGTSVDAFAASVVGFQRGAFNKRVDGNNLHGLHADLEHAIPGAILEPYALWRIAPGMDFTTVGARWVGKLPRNFDYGIDVARQQGRLGGGPLRAWAGHWVLGYTTGNIRWIAEYNYATGDGNPLDGRRETFQLLYPTPHDKYGVADRVGWRNIHHSRSGVEYKPHKKVQLTGNYHTWWLATTEDGLYTAPGALVAIKPGAPRHVGHEIDIVGTYSVSKKLQLSGGYGHVIRGGFLKATVPDTALDFGYVMWTLTL